MTITGKRLVPTSTVLQARVVIYQPSKKPLERKGQWIDTSFGRCRVTGRLGQRHADIVESMLFVAERRRDINDGGIELLVDPAKLRKVLSDNQYSGGRLNKLLLELKAATVEIVTPKLDQIGERIIGGLIDHVIPSPMTRNNPLPDSQGGVRRLWKVRLGIALVMLLERDLSLYYRPELIARLKHGISQAVARHVLTHNNNPPGSWYLDTLFVAVSGNDVSAKTMSNYRTRIKDDIESLRVIGVDINSENRVKRLTGARE
ncbi:ABC transporter ATPase [Proteus mirabilis]|nr:ABC transporter ATPase [Proteus mirabilis]MDE8641692.1 ABC transporter ATPase [Proteus mirabilis]